MRTVRSHRPMTTLKAARWCLVHAAALVGLMIVSLRGPTSSHTLQTIGSILWLVGLLGWPGWYVVIYRDKTHFTDQALAFLIVGTFLWVIAVLPIAGLLLLAVLWRGN